MKVILQEDVATLGTVGDLVDVSDGYARNFLIPRGLALRADPRNVRLLEHQQRLAAARKARIIAVAREQAAAISGTAVTIRRPSGEDGRLHGAVTNRDVADALAAIGVQVDRRMVELAEPLREIGMFLVPVKVHAEVRAEVKVYVVAD